MKKESAMQRMRAARYLTVLAVLACCYTLALFASARVYAARAQQPVPAATETPGGTVPPLATPLYLPAIAAPPSTPGPTPTSTDTPTVTPSPTITPTVTPTGTQSATPTSPPTSTATATPTATLVPRIYESVPVASGAIGVPAAESPDINLALRGYTPTVAYLGLVNYNGDTDPNAPQMDDLFTPARLPTFLAAYQVYDWNWSCNPPAGCRGAPINDYLVTLIAMGTTPGEAIAIPSRGPQIYAGGFKAMVLYATPQRITLTYTRDDTPAVGYLIHLEDISVAPELVALYEQLDREGRQRLPALRNGEVLGLAGANLKVAVRDTGQFMDPRACKDWWMHYMGQCTVHLERPR